MDNKLNELNKQYDNIKIPKELDYVIDYAINKGRDKKVIKPKRYNNILKATSIIAASLIIVLGLTVNSSYVLAMEVYKIPVIGELAKIITFREYTIENETSIGKVTIPNIEHEDNKVVEDLINTTINSKINEIIKEQAVLDEEYKKAYLETGGKEEDYRKIEMTVDYKLHYVSENLISFEIYKYQTLAPAYNEYFFFNINLKTGESLTIRDVLGENYGSIIKDNVEKQMISRMSEDANLLYDIDYLKEMVLTEDRSFYVTENGDIVVVFAKYEVASGAMGQQEFKVGNISNLRFPEEVTIIGEEIYKTEGEFISCTTNTTEDNIKVSTVTLKVDGEELVFESFIEYDYQKGELLKVKYVLEDGNKLVLLQCYPASNKIKLMVEKISINEEGLIIIYGKSEDGSPYKTSIDEGVKVHSSKENLEVGDTLEIYYDIITDDKVGNIIPYEMSVM